MGQSRPETYCQKINFRQCIPTTGPTPGQPRSKNTGGRTENTVMRVNVNVMGGTTIHVRTFLGSLLSSSPRPRMWEWAPIRSTREISRTSCTLATADACEQTRTCFYAIVEGNKGKGETVVTHDGFKRKLTDIFCNGGPDRRDEDDERKANGGHNVIVAIRISINRNSEIAEHQDGGNARTTLVGVKT